MKNLGKETLHEATSEDRPTEGPGKKAPSNLLHWRAQNLSKAAKIAGIVGSAAIGLVAIWRPDIAILLRSVLESFGQ